MDLRNYKLYDTNGFYNNDDGIFAHCERRKKADGTYIRYNNGRIHLEYTPLNYNLAEKAQPLPQDVFIKERLKTVKVLKRKDVTLLNSWIITAPKTLPREDVDLFMKYSYDFMCNRYSEKNVVSAYVHMDETSPHMHFLVLPICEGIDKRSNKKVEKLSNKAFNSLSAMKTIHKELQDYLFEKMGYKVDVLTGITKEQGGNIPVKELIRRTEENEAKAAQHEAAAATALKNAETYAAATCKAAEQEKLAVAQLREQAEAKVSEIQKVIDDGIAAANTKLGILENPRTKLKEVSAALIASENNYNSMVAARNADANSIKRLTSENQQLKNENTMLKRNMDAFKLVYAQCPEEFKQLHQEALRRSRSSRGNNNNWNNDK